MAEKIKCKKYDRNFPNQDALTMHNSAKHLINSKPKKNYAKTIFIIIILFALLIGGFLFFENKFVTGNSVKKDINNKNIQEITIGFKDYNYYPRTISVKQGIPVEITLDKSVGGCFRSFNIKSLSVSKYSSSPSDTITFTPNKKGSFEFACGMRMGYGTIVVK